MSNTTLGQTKNTQYNSAQYNTQYNSAQYNDSVSVLLSAVSRTLADKEKNPFQSKNRMEKSTSDKINNDKDNTEQVKPLISFASQNDLTQQNTHTVESTTVSNSSEHRKEEHSKLQNVVNNVNELKKSLKEQSETTDKSINTENSENLHKISENNINNTMENTEQSNETIFEYNELIANLKFLASVEKNQKLSVADGNLKTDGMYFGTITRWVWGEGRNSLYTVITKLITSADYYSEKCIKQLRSLNPKDENYDNVKRKLDSLTLDLNSSKKGIRNLIITYQGDDSYLAKLDICLENITVRSFKNMNAKL